MTTHPNIEQHPDLAEMRTRFEQVTSTPRAQAVEAMALITGLYIAASPWIAGFSGFGSLAVNNLIAGLAYCLCMGGLGSAYERTHAMAWTAVVIAAWTIVAPWVIAGDVSTTRTVLSNVIAGAVALLLALAMAGMAGRDRRAG
ncbi:SPW repeat protein [Streptomyces sp. NPDC060334]|uniref:SPW repeat protein n=1 Tax=unclassified Streptomyces TaxID=2593676 RepID=UPI0006AFCF65|nr:MULTISPECIES: SPW repeat protein [unclassified Streptomyces]KOU43133.1 membrane protein [Streptomyces sp. WM4235]MCX5076541.1 SPW repeat protein [Streptomyces sp. NBC_00424]MCX5156582.1 SPW repeat protein [Streptomyces sp. NBC_00291]WUD40431.1 SPW repeat protein [Streptomyces sp. NBC_00513]